MHSLLKTQATLSTICNFIWFGYQIIRKQVLDGKIAVRLQELINKAAQVNGWKIHELNIQRDHVHILIQVESRLNVAKVVQILKGGTSIKIRSEFPALMEFLWGGSFWADGYFAESIGTVQEEMVRKYIREQKKDQSMPKG